jgi:hypothetical protein
MNGYLIIVIVTMSIQSLPVFIFHGFGVDCKKSLFKNRNVTIGEYYSGQCIETDSLFLQSAENLHIQARVGCQKLEEIIFGGKGKTPRPEYAFGISLVGVSQGGMIARLVFLKCPRIRKEVKRLFTLGTPNIGLQKIPEAKYVAQEVKRPETKVEKLVHFFNLEGKRKDLFRIINNVIDLANEGNFSMLDNSVSALQYFKKDNKYTPFLEGLLTDDTPWLEFDTKPEQDRSLLYDGLELMMNFGYKHDTIIYPISSSIFGIEWNKETNRFGEYTGKFPGLEHKTDLGLKKLYDKGRMVNCMAAGNHGFMTIHVGKFRNFLQDDCHKLELQKLVDELASKMNKEGELRPHDNSSKLENSSEQVKKTEYNPTPIQIDAINETCRKQFNARLKNLEFSVFDCDVIQRRKDGKLKGVDYMLEVAIRRVI